MVEMVVIVCFGFADFAISPAHSRLPYQLGQIITAQNSREHARSKSNVTTETFEIHNTTHENIHK